MNYELINGLLLLAKDVILAGVIVVTVIDNSKLRNLIKMVEENAEITNLNLEEFTTKHNRMAKVFREHVMKCHDCKQCTHCKEEKESE